MSQPTIHELVKLLGHAQTIINAVQNQGLHHELPAQARAAIAEFEGVDLSGYLGGFAPGSAPHLPDGGSIL